MSRSSMRYPRAGFTMIEVLVAVSIIGILIALILPAVQAAREAGRRADCANKLRQIGISFTSHQGNHGSFPSGIRPDALSAGGQLRAGSPALSAHTSLLPYLELTNLFNAINFDGTYLGVSHDNATAFQVQVATFLCPSDSYPSKPGNSYRACVGSMPWELDSRLGGGGAFPGLSSVRPSDIADGLSTTVGFSERVRGSDRPSFDKLRDVWYSGISSIDRPSTSDEMVAACSALRGSPAAFWPAAGQSWSNGRYADTLYNHVMILNALPSDCSADLAFGMPGDISGGAVSARSAHSNGVYVVFMDGSVKFVKNSIDLMVWRALATRSGHEMISVNDM